jgi:hypothetical protein
LNRAAADIWAVVGFAWPRLSLSLGPCPSAGTFGDAVGVGGAALAPEATMAVPSSTTAVMTLACRQARRSDDIR